MRKMILLAVIAAKMALGAEYHLPGDFTGIHEALEALHPGDTLLVGHGVYTIDTDTIDLRAGQEGALITVRAIDGAEPVFRASNDYAFKLKAPWWTMEGMRFDGRDCGRDVVTVRASHIVLKDCTVTNGNRDGIDIGAVVDVEINGCLIYDIDAGGSDAHGIAIDDAEDVRILGCEIYNCSGDCIQIYAAGSPLADRVLIDGCHLWTNWPSSENAIDVKASTNISISRCRCHGFKGDSLCAAIVIHQAVTNACVEKSLLYDCVAGIRVNMSLGGRPRSIKLRHNVMRDMVDIGGPSGYGIQLDDVIGAEIYDNTMAFLPGSSFWLASTLEDVRIKNNLVVSCGEPHYDSPLYVGSTEFDHQGWFDAVPLGADGPNSIEYPDAQDAKFVDAGARDLRLQADSPAREAGVDVGLPYSGSAPDLGAYDFDYSVDWPSSGGDGGGGSGGESSGGCGRSALPAFVCAILVRRRRCESEEPGPRPGSTRTGGIKL